MYQVKASSRPQHPKYSEMIVAAIRALKDRRGSSRQAIVKYIKENYEVSDNCAACVRRALGKNPQRLWLNTRGTGASGSFKLDLVKMKALAKPKKPTTKPKKPTTKPKKPTKAKGDAESKAAKKAVKTKDGCTKKPTTKKATKTKDAKNQSTKEAKTTATKKVKKTTTKSPKKPQAKTAKKPNSPATKTTKKPSKTTTKKSTTAKQ